MNENILVQVDHLTKYFPIKGQKGPGVQAVEDVSLFIRRGETLGLEDFARLTEEVGRRLQKE